MVETYNKIKLSFKEQWTWWTLITKLNYNLKSGGHGGHFKQN